MKYFLIVCSALIISGCSIRTTEQEVKTQTLNYTSPLMVDSAPSLEKLVNYRTWRCKNSRQEIEAEVEQYLPLQSASSQLELFVLASCLPENYRSLLLRQLTLFENSNNWPDSYRSFADLLLSQLKFRDAKIAEKNKTIEKLNKTIEALTKIEQELEGRE